MKKDEESPDFQVNLIYSTFIICIWAVYLFELYLCIRQRRVLHFSAHKVPSSLKDCIKLEAFEDAKRFEIKELNFSLGSDFYRMVVLTVLLQCEGLYIGWQLAEAYVAKYCTTFPSGDGLTLLNTNVCFIILSIGFYNFVMENPVGMFQINSSHILKNLNSLSTKNLLLHFGKGCIKTCPLAHLLHFILHETDVRESQPFMLFVIIPIISSMELFHNFLNTENEPESNDETAPLKDGPLRTRLEALAARVGFPFSNLLVSKVSHRTTYANASTSWSYNFKNKFIILEDTLIKGYVTNTDDQSQTKSNKGVLNDEEVEAVFSHELAHWKFNHAGVLHHLGPIILLNCIFGLTFVVKQHWDFSAAFGFPYETEILFSIQAILTAIFMCWVAAVPIDYLWHKESQRWEFEADGYATELGYGKELKSALIKLTKNNLTFPISDPLYSVFYHTHPSLLESLAAIDQVMMKIK